jgi:hypothetical protein
MVSVEKVNCPICTEDRNKKIIVICPKCSFSSCRICFTKYLLGSSNITATCMNCKTGLDSDFIYCNTNEEFHNKKFRKHISKNLMEREKSLLPETQPFVVIEKEKIKNMKKLEQINKKIAQYTLILKNLKEERRNIAIKEYKEEKISTVFIGHCPKDDCKGYLNSEYKCGICNLQSCKSCRQLEHPEQKCNKDIVETVKLMSKDTKSCPNCLIPITKISGCSQMYCVSCHTAFNWETMEIVTNGRIHNPHFFEYQRKIGVNRREVGDVICGGAPHIRNVLAKLKEVCIPEEKITWVMNAFRLSNHIRDVNIRRYNIVENNDTNRDLRIKYLMGEIDENKWVSELNRRLKKREKCTAVVLILTMLVDTLDVLFGNIVISNDIKNIIDELEELQKYTIDRLEKISKRFGNKVIKIYSNWSIKEVGK